MNEIDAPLTEVYAAAAGDNREAFSWLMAWHGWCHALDDFVDQREEPRDRSEVVQLCADGVVLTASGFFRRHAEALAPLIVVVAEEYRSSLTRTGTMADVLRLGGNHVVLAVAYITGGRPRVREVGDRLWPIVQATQLESAL